MSDEEDSIRHNEEEEEEEEGDDVQMEDDDEEEEEEDEEEARKIADGFIDDDEEVDSDEEEVITVKKKKRKKAQPVEEEDLDEEDLDLLEENTGIKISRAEPQFKRLKRGRQETTSFHNDRNEYPNFFSDDDMPEDEEPSSSRRRDRQDRDVDSGGDTPRHDREDGRDRGDRDDYRVEERREYLRRDRYDEMKDFIADDDEDDDLDEVTRRDRDDRREHERVARKGGREDYYEDRERRRARARDVLEDLPAGIDQDALDDVYDIFGDGTDYEYALYAQEPMAEDEEERREPQLRDVFEPSLLRERLLTEEDENIRARDVPERMQLRYQGIIKDELEPLSERDQTEEAQWIARILSRSKGKEGASDTLQQAVRHVVRFLTEEFLEVPFIAAHRRDYFTSVDPNSNEVYTILDLDDLWSIYDLDFRFRGFLDRRAVLQEFYSKLGVFDDLVDDMIAKAERVEEISDLTDYLHFRYAEDVERIKRSHGTKRPPIKSQYESELKIRLRSFAKDIGGGMTVRELGSNFLENNRRFYSDDVPATPEQKAEEFMDVVFDTPEKALKMAKQMMAKEIAFDPQVRKVMRREWEAKATVTVRPMERGMQVIDELHPYHPFKYLTGKPVSAFKDGQFLQILKSEQQGLTKVTITIKEYDRWFKSFEQLFLSDGFSDLAQRWNNERIEVLQAAMRESLIPMLQKHIREKLRMEAQDWVCAECKRKLEEKVEVGPFRTSHTDRDVLPRVLGVSWGNGDQKDIIMMAFLNHEGHFTDDLRLANLKDEANVKKFTEFLLFCKPHVIGIAGFNLQTRRLIEQVQAVLSSNNKDQSGGDRDRDRERDRDSRGRDRDRDRERERERDALSNITVTVVDDEVARLYQQSRRAQEEFKELPPLMRYCIALARRLQSPLNEYAALGKDLSSIRYHELQGLVPEEKLLAILERALINVVNVMGVDINEAIESPYIAHTLQYVSGLGPRKAQSILKRIEATGGELESRADLVTRKITTKVIWMNCPSFIRIRHPDDVLDDTRIHPQDYELARKMASDALDVDEEDVDDMITKKNAVADLIKNYPEKLNELMLEDYAEQLYRETKMHKRQTLEQIKQELQYPYKDQRRPFQKPNIMQTFQMISGETPQTLREGLIVPVMITKTKGKWANGRLDSGLDAVIGIDHVSDERISNVDEKLHVSDIKNCKVIKIDRERYLVELSSRESDTRGGDLMLRRLQDDLYNDRNAEEEAKDKLMAKRRKESRNNRVIKHPLFRNFTFQEAENYLANRQRGDAVIRPSSKGNDHIAITWKVDKDLYQHIDVFELDKDNEFAVGKKLMVGSIDYTDLDQVLVAHVEAMARKVDELLTHPKYKSGGLAHLYEFLTSTTMANPKQSAYGICTDSKPGFFDIAFKLNARTPPNKWTVKVLPNGYRLKETDYPTVDELINGFKKLHMGNGRTPQGPPGSGSSRGRPPLGGNMHGGLPPPPPAHLYPPPPPAQMYGHHPPPPGHHGSHYPAPPPPPRAANPMATGPIPGVPVGGIPGYRR
ncbi:hypothetical protein BC937DRAFT_91142 [Endogone sp. FLAS-F59071]|nr:hypothetical protein BC937DRAFT_91142 [Endogone sp. FLAS-F59071]|eukprot:RUS16496.1 hypothetical protein BC937DRAFT_91142 [Endogone sp. FLAS-F59071]